MVPIWPVGADVAGQREEGTTGKMPVLLSVSEAGGVTHLRRLRWLPGKIGHRMRETEVPVIVLLRVTTRSMFVRMLVGVAVRGIARGG